MLVLSKKSNGSYNIGGEINKDKILVAYSHLNAKFLKAEIIKIFTSRYSVADSSNSFIGLERDLVACFMHLISSHEKLLTTHLLEACNTNNIDIINTLISVGVNIHTRNEYCLRWACLNGNLDIVAAMVGAGANIEINNGSPLRLASKYGFIAIVDFLLACGANIHAYEDNSLQIAVERGNVIMVKFLLSKGANIHLKNDILLELACRRGNLDMVKLLVANGANIHVNKNNLFSLAKGEISKFLVLQDINT